jgi:hypothetical protein
MLLAGFGLAVALFAAAWLIRRRALFFRKPFGRPAEDRQMRRLLRSLRKTQGSLGIEDVHASWQLVEARLRRLGVLLPPQPSLDEMGIAIASSSVLDGATIQLIQQIIPEIERIKYQGAGTAGFDTEFCSRMCRLVEQLLDAKDSRVPR